MLPRSRKPARLTTPGSWPNGNWDRVGREPIWLTILAPFYGAYFFLSSCGKGEHSREVAEI